jgi:hypothetical protein
MVGGKDETLAASTGLDHGGPIGTAGSPKPPTARAAGRCRTAIEGGSAVPDCPGAGYAMSAIMRGGRTAEDHL